MHLEISVALNFLISYLYSKLPRRRVNMLAEEMDKYFRMKFQNHWYPEKPSKGSGYRCFKITPDKIDRILIDAAHDAGLDEMEILEYLPPDLTIWIDPGEVSYRIGEKGMVKVLYSNENTTSAYSSNNSPSTETSSDGEESTQVKSARYFNPEAKSFRPKSYTSARSTDYSSGTSSLWSYGSSMLHLPGASSFASRKSSSPLFTTATFAQTKFGSTKTKNASKRHHMLPDEFSAYIKQKAQHQQMMQFQNRMAQLYHMKSDMNNFNPNYGSRAFDHYQQAYIPNSISMVHNAENPYFSKIPQSTAFYSNNCAYVQAPCHNVQFPGYFQINMLNNHSMQSNHSQIPSPDVPLTAFNQIDPMILIPNFQPILFAS